MESHGGHRPSKRTNSTSESATSVSATSVEDEENPYFQRRYTVEQSSILDLLNSSSEDEPETFSDHEEEAPVSHDQEFNEEEHKQKMVAEAEQGGGAKAKMPGDALEFHCVIVSNTYTGKHCLPSGELKPRRPRPQIRARDFFSQLHKTRDGRYVFTGSTLNGWGGLSGPLEVLSLTGKVKKALKRASIRRFWDAAAGKGARSRKKEEAPAWPSKFKGRSLRARLRKPAWANEGWAKDSKGFVWWAALQKMHASYAVRPNSTSLDRAPPRYVVHFGERMISELQKNKFTDLQLSTSGPASSSATSALDESPTPSVAPALSSVAGREEGAVMTQVSLFGHRYSKRKEGVKDLLTYHVGCLVEWDHARFATLVELAWLNGVSGYGGRANWYTDKNVKGPTVLFKALAPCMKSPWNNKRAEIRVHDLAFASNLQDFLQYLIKHTGTRPGDLFLHPEILKSAPVRVSHRTQRDLMRYLLNYNRRSPVYNEETRNCQTFGCDLFSFLAGVKRVEPMTKVLRVFYKPRPYLFLYDP